MYKVFSDISIRLEAIATELREKMRVYYDSLDSCEIDELDFIIDNLNDAANTIGVIVDDK